MNDFDLINVSVLIPRTRLAELYALAASWSRPDSTEPAHPEETDDLGWRPHDDEIAFAVVAASNARGRAVYRALAKKAGSPVSYVDLDMASGLDGPHRAGLLGAIGRTCRTRGRTTPWTWDSKRHTYRMPKELGDLFLNALERVEEGEKLLELAEADPALASQLRDVAEKVSGSARGT